MRSKNSHSWRIGTINICTGKDDQKIERVIHEIAKAKTFSMSPRSTSS